MHTITQYTNAACSYAIRMRTYAVQSVHAYTSLIRVKCVGRNICHMEHDGEVPYNWIYRRRLFSVWQFFRVTGSVSCWAKRAGPGTWETTTTCGPSYEGRVEFGCLPLPGLQKDGMRAAWAPHTSILHAHTVHACILQASTLHASILHASTLHACILYASTLHACNLYAFTLLAWLQSAHTDKSTNVEL